MPPTISIPHARARPGKAHSSLHKCSFTPSAYKAFYYLHKCSFTPSTYKAFYYLNKCSLTPSA
ncbi:hypothetical protein HanXRQr2_Chr07g0279931 [Helianthus annuus]|uniref:Uncharacterized protein n=1 Tax=Helianthus annuus TaxID=4232 RepID=A0A9K3IHY8_HELAN|nr:hypothetical protein HanXRQr2_Chr07g0279931 [Helianthus annuus]KAJ0903561.1 hypothetical protein HanPSC8_Chr07g0271311 [Helianthus annuus]